MTQKKKKKKARKNQSKPLTSAQKRKIKYAKGSRNMKPDRVAITSNGTVDVNAVLEDIRGAKKKKKKKGRKT